MSANAISAEGVLVNIDGTGNRISAATGAHEVVCYLVGRNKVAPTFDQALWRARNVAAPKRAQSMGCRTPCAAKADRCYDCKSRAHLPGACGSLGSSQCHRGDGSRTDRRGAGDVSPGGNMGGGI